MKVFKAKNRPLFGMLLLCCVLFGGTTLNALAYDALYAFGDSLTDTGNNPPGPSSGTNYYYGRFSNGPLWVQYMSTNLGFAYVPSNNYAYSGSQTAYSLGAVESLSPPADAATAVFAVWSGGNDFLQNLSVESQTNDPLWAGVISNAVYNLTNCVRVLYADGARTIIVPNLPDVSQVPEAAVLTASYRSYISGKVSQFNAGLSLGLNSVLAASPGLTLTSPNIFTNFSNILANAAAYGLTKTNVGALEDPTLTDKSFNGPGSDYVFWDSVHPTTKVHALIANWVFATLPASGPIPLLIRSIGNSVVLTWTSPSFALQASTTVNGTFTNIPSATSPYTNTLNGPQTFFRLASP